VTKIVNEEADVSGTISARRLGRIYYTGTIADDVVSSSVQVTGPIKDVLPGN
jgi:hypothetical protein